MSKSPWGTAAPVLSLATTMSLALLLHSFGNVHAVLVSLARSLDSARGWYPEYGEVLLLWELD